MPEIQSFKTIWGLRKGRAKNRAWILKSGLALISGNFSLNSHRTLGVQAVGNSLSKMAGDDGTIDGLTEDDLIDDAEIDTLIREAVSQVIGDNQFTQTKLNQWSTNCVEGCLKRLAALNKPFKYVVTCNMTQKAGAGLHTASCTRWNEKTDGKMSVQWENQTMLILVTVYWMAI